MKKNLLFKATAVLTMIALALVITFVPGTALAAISGVTIAPGAGESYTIPVVITSYSIHYTKLYDRCCGSRADRAERCRAGALLGGIQTAQSDCALAQKGARQRKCYA